MEEGMAKNVQKTVHMVYEWTLWNVSVPVQFTCHKVSPLNSFFIKNFWCKFSPQLKISKLRLIQENDSKNPRCEQLQIGMENETLQHGLLAKGGKITFTFKQSENVVDFKKKSSL